MSDLKRKSGSKRASVEEIGELAAIQSLSRKLSDKWGESRSIHIDEELSSKQKQELAAVIYEDVKKSIREHNSQSKGWEDRGIGKLAIDATNPSAEPDEVREAVKMLRSSGLGFHELLETMASESVLRGRSARVWHNKKLTNYGMRVIALKKEFGDK